MDQGRLLVLDDDATVGQILVMSAQALGLQAQQFNTVETFIEAVGPLAPSHVAVDLTLPGSSGSDVLRRLAAADCRAKVIVYSGAGAAELAAAQDEARQLGLNVAGGLAKPFTLARLRVLLNGTS